jgi:hypothetical protein
MQARAGKQDQQAALRLWQQGAIFLLSYALIVSRRPDAVLHAQFYAEDGHVWFADAYNLGWWQGLFRAQDGYFQTFPRLAAALALLAPVWRAPLVLNLCAAAVEALPVNLLLSVRSSGWGSLGFRACLAAAYLALPNSREMTMVVTSSQWLLALSVFLVLTASQPGGEAERAFDVALLVLCGLTGPFCFFLLPIAVFVAWKRKKRWHWMAAGILSVLAMVEAWGLVVIDKGGRSHAALGAGPALLVRILGGQVYLAALLGGNSLASNSSRAVFFLLLLAAITGTALVIFCFVHTSLEMRLFFVLTAMLLIASMISPAAYPPSGVTRWELLAKVSGIRYWYFPTLAFVWSMLWASRSRSQALQAVSILLLCGACFGAVRDWKQPVLKDLNFEKSARNFQTAPAGTVIVLPENPQGWDIRLVKHPTQ